MRRVGAVLVAVLAVLAVGVAPARPAYAIPPTSPDCKPVQNHRLITETPWPVRRYRPDRIWPLTTGTGVTVAVLDSGVDAAHPQLAGHVDAGKDFLDNRPSAAFDCVGHGTGVASVIAAAPRDGVGFVGLAPGVRILPVRVSERSEVSADGGSQGASVDSGGLAQAIRFAVDQHARVINMSIYQFVDDQRVHDAVDYALGHDVVVVAAAGNSHDTTAGAVDPTPYPAAYDGVVGVGSIDQSGTRSSDSQVGPYVDLVAPGSDVTLAANKSGDYWVGEGTSFAAPYVAATAALIRSRWPSMPAEDVVRQLEGTADAVPGGPHSGAYGYGEVDPFRAVNEVVSKAKPQQAPPLARPVRDVTAERAAASRARTVRLAGWFTAAVAVVIGLVLLLAWVLPRGRRRRWRAGETPISAPPAPVDDSGMYSWSLGPPPAIPNPDRAVDEELVRILRERRR